MTEQLNSALALAAQGLPVFPVWWMAGGSCACGQPCTSPGKHPITPRGLHDGSLDAAKIAEWWRIAPQANVGVALPDGVAVIDVDPRNGGEATFEALEAKHGKLPVTRTAVTGGSGGHFWFRLPAGVALPVMLDSYIGPGIDIKQLGGYVLAPPSNHVSGGSYRWVGSGDSPIADAPPWLLALGWPRGERVTVTLEDESERLADDATLDAIAATVEPHFVQGKMHHICKNLAGWMKQRGYGLADVNYIIEKLPCRNTKNGLDAAKGAFRIERAFGWNELRGLLGEAPAATLDAATPNPRRQVEAASASALAQGMAASAVVLQPVQAPPALAPGQLPTWYLPAEIPDTPKVIDYVVPQLELGPGRVNMVVGYSNAGKSLATLALAFSIAMGLPAWGEFLTKRKRVLYLDAENIDVTLENVSRLAKAAGVPLQDVRQWLTVVPSRYHLDSPTAEPELAVVLQRERYGAAFIDTLRASAPSTDENKAEISQPLYMLGRVSAGLGVTLFVLHHEKKPGEGDKRSASEYMISGHNSIHGALGVSLSLLRDDDSGLISVRSSKRIRRAFAPFQLRIVDVGGATVGDAVAAGESSPGVRVEYVGAAPEKPMNEDTLSSAIVRILTWLRSNAGDGRQIRVDSLLRKSEEGGCGGKKSTNLAAIERLERDGQVHTTNSPRMIALVVDAAPYDPRSVAPPPDPTAQELRQDMAGALYAQHGGPNQ